jgi:ribosomal protein S18 acetylase RimI-like enzyme
MTRSIPNFNIQPLQPKDQAEVRALILAGLVEHWVVLDPGRNPDLEDISQSYAGAVFLVAREQDRIVGTGALVPRGQQTGEIVRMSVALDMRRRGVGRRLLERLIREANAMGMCQLVLETTETWQGAIEFYQRFGFQETHRMDGDVYFRLEI